MKLILFIWLAFPLISVADNNLKDSDKLFDYAESIYPKLFSPAKQHTHELSNYLVRYYPDNNIYIGTKGSEVYVYGDIFNGLLNVGLITDYIEIEPDSDKLLANLFSNSQSDVQVQGKGTVVSILSDDIKGIRHQRFIIRLVSSQTLLVAHNIDLAPRINNLSVGDSIEFFGEYEWNNQGGVIHWTHYDPAGHHVDGWVLHNEIVYQTLIDN